MPFNVPIVADTTALRVQQAWTDEEPIFDAQERRLYVGKTGTLGGVPCWHTSLLDVNNKTLIAGVGGATVVNHLEVTAGTVGLPARLAAVGSDTDVSLYLLAKGAGKVYAGPSGAQVPIGQRLSANPGSGVDGEVLYRTDLHDPFWRRTGENKWLGTVREHAWGFASATNGAYGRVAGIQASASLGPRMPKAATVTAIAWSLTLSGSAPSGALEIVRADGTPTLLLSHPTGGSSTGQTDPINGGTGLDISAAVGYAVRWNDGGAGVSITTGWVQLFIRERAT